MQSIARNSALSASSRPPLRFRILAWLIQSDAAYRDAHKLASAPQHRLDDMGIGRSEADAGFLRRFRDRDLSHPTHFGW